MRISPEIRRIIYTTYSYVEGSKELPHLAAAVAYLYKSPLYEYSAAPPESTIAPKSSSILMRFNNPLGMKPLNSMLRHFFNVFSDVERMMNWNDYDALECEENKIFFHARSLCSTLSRVFDILSKAEQSNTREKAAKNMFNTISDFVRRLPPTRREERTAEAKATELRIEAGEKAVVERLAAEVKAAADKEIADARREEERRSEALRLEAVEAATQALRRQPPPLRRAVSAAGTVTSAPAPPKHSGWLSAAPAAALVAAPVAAPVVPLAGVSKHSGWLSAPKAAVGGAVANGGAGAK